MRRVLRRTGVFLGLVSIALQLFLTFSHVHLEDILAYGPFDGTRIAALSAPHAGTADPVADTADSCPLCASIMLAGSLLVPDGPALRPAGFVILVSHAMPERPAIAVPRHLRPSSRAPPAI